MLMHAAISGLIAYDVVEGGGIDETVIPQIPVPLPNISFSLSF